MTAFEGRIINRYSSVTDLKQACDQPVDRDRLVDHPCYIGIIEFYRGKFSLDTSIRFSLLMRRILQQTSGFFFLQSKDGSIM